MGFSSSKKRGENGDTVGETFGEFYFIVDVVP